jgi:hypothetical protein
VKPFAKPTGIDISEAEVPPGEHLVRVEIHDSEGRQTSNGLSPECSTLENPLSRRLLIPAGGSLCAGLKGFGD